MASRRVRIKGIANIPQRRKPANAINGSESEERTENDNKIEEITDKPNLNLTSNSHVNTLNPADGESVIDTGNPVSETGIKCEEDVKKKFNTQGEVLGPKLVPLIQATNDDDQQKRSNTAVHSNKIEKNEVGKVQCTDKVPINRRKFLKPLSVNSINRKTKEIVEEVRTELSKETKKECSNISLSEIETSTSNTISSVLSQKSESSLGPNLEMFRKKCAVPHCPSAIYNPETRYFCFPANAVLCQRWIDVIGNPFHGTTLAEIRNRYSVCSEHFAIEQYQTPERLKLNRKQLPRLCLPLDSNVREIAPVHNIVHQPVVQRKCRRTEQTRKFAEARREFNMKFNNGKPDKQKLTMIDLIFYNPATSPMSYNKRKRKSTSSSDVSDTRSKSEEEKIDDPQPASESDNELPAPQIKVGPNGEIIVDEKSLIIENAETKRGRAALQMSEVVDGDEDTSYGIYKKIKRPKEWSKEETLRFYKALNTIGTDFTLMCELFPSRTRRELKMKFKKEERLNQSLINKAVMQPCEFDITELRKDLEIEERRAEEKKKRIEEVKALKAAAIEQKKTMKKSLKIKGVDMSPDSFSTPLETELVVKEKPIKKQRKTAYDVIKRGINSILSGSDEDEDLNEMTSSPNSHHNGEDSEDQENISKILKPTRYGRVPKARVRDTFGSEKHSKKRRKRDSEGQSDENKQGDLEPGSIMIVKTKNPSDEVVYKVYIVTDNKTKQELDLTPNVLKDLSEIGGEQMKSDKKVDDIQAHSILTISAQEYPNNKEFDSGNIVASNEVNEKQVNGHILNCDPKEVQTDNSDSLNNEGKRKILGDDIIIPFDECLLPTVANQNITVSHEDNKMIVVTENNKQCILTT